MSRPYQLYGNDDTGLARQSSYGFTMVELSIVLAILGLIVGGVLVGKSLVRASELRAISGEYMRYVAAINNFREKYSALPGDMGNATQFWKRTVNSTDCITNSSASVSTPGTCDGNGDGKVLISTTTNGISAEAFQAWRQLALADLLAGSYTGYVGATGSDTLDSSVLGSNVPQSKLSGAGWMITYVETVNGDANSFTAPISNTLFFGGNYITGGLNSGTYGAVLTPQEAWNIDSKIDDGRPASGKVFVRWRSACTNSSSMTDYAATYLTGNSTIGCSLQFPAAF